MLDFGMWMAKQEGTVEDASVITKPDDSGCRVPNKRNVLLQIFYKHYSQYDWKDISALEFAAFYRRVKNDIMLTDDFSNYLVNKEYKEFAEILKQYFIKIGGVK